MNDDAGSSTTGSEQDRRNHQSSGDGTRRLMKWSTGAAMIGLVLSVTTLACTIWFSRLLTLQAELLAPAAQMAARMDSDISRSIAALRGWVAYCDPRFCDERREIWRDIEANFDQFRTLAEPRLQAEHRRSFELFRTSLNELKHIQWAIEDVAHTPGNEPASQGYNRNIVPIRRSIERAFRAGTVAARRELAGSPDLFFEMAVFHALLMAMDVALQEYVRNPSLVSLQSYENKAHEFQQLSRTLEERLEEQNLDHAPAMRSLAEFVTAEAGAYRIRGNHLTWERRHREGTVAQSLFRYRALPLARFVSQRMRYISSVQAESAAQTARLFKLLGLAVVAGSLLIGIASASSLFVTFRIRNRVGRALDRATKLGQYAVEKKLGTGGMGEVYLASHAMLRRPAAIKLLRGENRANRRAKERFRTEVQLTSRLTHPNTVSIFDYGVTPEGTFYYAMEYLDGATLQQLVDATGPMSSSRVIHILDQIAGSLQEAHDRGLLHRDIKPANIMLCALGGVADTVKVLDFGLVRELSDDPGARTEGGRLEGTPLYVAPESILDAAGSEARSDLYAVGAVGYFLLCGFPPFSAPDVIELLCQHLSDTPTPPSGRTDHLIDPQLERIVLDCLEKDPEKRPSSAQALRERLRACPDFGRWTEANRATWWAEFGEAVTTRKGGDDSGGTASELSLAVRVATRTTSSEI